MASFSFFMLSKIRNLSSRTPKTLLDESATRGKSAAGIT